MIKEILVEVDHILENNLFFVFEGLAVLELVLETIKSFSNHDGDIVSDLKPKIVINFSRVSNSLEDLSVRWDTSRSSRLSSFSLGFSSLLKVESLPPFSIMDISSLMNLLSSWSLTIYDIDEEFTSNIIHYYIDLWLEYFKWIMIFTVNLNIFNITLL